LIILIDSYKFQKLIGVIMKKFVLFISFFGFLSLNIMFAQTASVTWYLTSDSLVSATSGGVLGQAEVLSNMQINSYQGTTGSGAGNSQLCRITGGSWPADTAQVNNRYIQFAVLPKPGNIFNVDSISLYYGGRGGSNVRSNICISTDSTFTTYTKLNSTPLAISASGGTMQRLSYYAGVKVNDGQVLYMRVYPWYTSASTGKYVCLQNLAISGNATGAAVNASATWYLTSDSNLSATSGSLTGLGETYSGMEKYSYGTVAGSSTGNSQINRITGGSWPADTNQNNSRYIQFVVYPKTGNTFSLDSISMYYGGKGGGNVRSNIAISTDSTFTTFTKLNSTPLAISVSAGIMQYISYQPVITTTEGGRIPFNAPEGSKVYLRVYPWYTSASTGKYVCLQNVTFWGKTSGPLSADPPVIVTSSISNISTTTAVCGGSVSSDGGSPVTARGVCWNLTGNPTIADSKTSDGTGSGKYSSNITGLTPATKYYVRAYATNIVATSYGKLDSLTTLAALVIPTVTTSDMKDIMVTTATAGGNVSAWGGTEVTVRGVCYNTTGNPTINDKISTSGTGIGTYSCSLVELTKNTKYYVRAYATNSTGTGYGEVKEFTTQSPAVDVRKVVAKDGSGDYKTVAEAFRNVPDNYTGNWTIYIKKGVYFEKDTLTRTKFNVTIEGEDRKNTIIMYDDYSGRVVGGQVIGTSTAQTVWIQGTDITIKNITIKDTSTAAQAVALNLSTGDRITLIDVDLLGFQDTYYHWNCGRVYHKNCLIQGSVDFIFGNGIAVFDNCTINCNREGGCLTAGSTDAKYLYGYVFRNCKITSDAIGFDGRPITRFYLGRPWQNSPRTVFIGCEEPATLDSTGWTTMNVTPALYAEYGCYGPGSKTNYRVSFSRQLTAAEASQYTIANIFSKNTGFGAADWIPSIVTEIKEEKTTTVIPKEYNLSQNYPNPFNPSTNINYSLPSAGFVTLKIYDILGREVKALLNGYQQAGSYKIAWDASGVSSGVYYYKLQAGDFMTSKKMLLCK
jgi:pectin methylesterase-like acyl-CoA thioesterase